MLKFTNLRIKSKQKCHQRRFVQFIYFLSHSHAHEASKDLKTAEKNCSGMWLGTQTLTEQSSWGQSQQAPLPLPAMDSWTWRISLRETSRQAPTTVSRSSLHPLPGLINCECNCNSRYMPRPYYQQRLGLQGHMVTDWVDWLGVSISNAWRPPDVTFSADAESKKKKFTQLLF